MDRNTLVRWALIAGAMLLFFKFGMPLITGKKEHTQPTFSEHYVDAPDFVGDKVDPGKDGVPNSPPEGELCTLKHEQYKAELSSRGASITHFILTDEQYANGPEGFDLSTTPAHERWRSLRTLFREEGGNDQLAYDRFLWKLEPGSDGSSCTFSYEDDTVKLTKVVRTTDRPFELDVATTVDNKSDAAKRHRFSIATFAFRRNEETKSKLGRVSPFLTHVTCASSDDIERKAKGDFKEGPFVMPETDRFAAVSNHYFGQALVPAEGVRPDCVTLAEDWFSAGQDVDDDSAATVFHAKLLYPVKELAPHESVTYRETAFFGPKERNVLKAVGGGRAKLGDLIDLGFFSPVAKGLVWVLVTLHDKVTLSWGLAIILMTFCVRLVLFPLSLKQIQTTLAMRRLKPELDELHARFKDDPQGKQLATMELYKKRGVNMFGGCLPQLVQMPVWWAMYTTLQTAVEMYHTRFLWFTDLSSPDKYFILPITLGALGFVQARIMPQQPGADPAQQKMMLYMMPAIFTVMMLFMPAALGVYMATNSLLGIVQQLAVEQFAKGSGSQPPPGEIVVTEVVKRS